VNVGSWIAAATPARVTLPELIASMAAGDVLAAVRSGELTVDEAIAAERDGRARADLIAALHEL
jgi:hypothetical protein